MDKVSLAGLVLDLGQELELELVQGKDLELGSVPVQESVSGQA